MSLYSRILKDHRLQPQIGLNCKPLAQKGSYLSYLATMDFCHWCCSTTAFSKDSEFKCTSSELFKCTSLELHQSLEFAMSSSELLIIHKKSNSTPGKLKQTKETINLSSSRVEHLHTSTYTHSSLIVFKCFNCQIPEPIVLMFLLNFHTK